MQTAQKKPIIAASVVAILIVGAIAYWFIGHGPGGMNRQPEVTYSGIAKLTQNVRGVENGAWYAVEEGGDAVGTENKLVFTRQSMCSFGDRTYVCEEINLHDGDRAMVRGEKHPDGTLDVVSMRFLGESASRPVTKTVEVFYYHESYDRQQLSDGTTPACSEDAVRSVKKELTISPAIIEDTIRYVLVGEITPEDKEQGYSTFFPQHELNLTQANVVKNTLTLEFDGALSGEGHPCAKKLLQTQIEKTALQFPEVKKVKIVPESIFAK